MNEPRIGFISHQKVTLFVVSVVILAVMSAAFYAFLLFNTWNQVRLESMQAQTRIEEIIQANNIRGYARVLFYFERVEFVGEGFGKEEIFAMKDVCQDYKWIKFVEISESSMSSHDLTEISKEFAPIVVWIR